MAIEAAIMKKIEEWTKPPYDSDCIEEIKGLLSDNNEQELMERFAVDLNFGTGGLRGIIRNGTNGMNIYIIRKATQGLANYVNQNNLANPKAAIAFDSRKYSKEFAKEAANVLASNGIKTYVFKELRPTPELSFAIRHLNCATGIVLTASHNPKEYNGYKAYWNDGSQVIAPHDQGIINEVRKISNLNMVKTSDFDQLVASQMIEWIGEEIDDAFIDVILNNAINKDQIQGSDVKIVYTPLHGTGGTIMPKAVKKMGLPDLFTVSEQMKADSAFSTVDYPNPEESAALNMAIELAKKENADVVIGTDPDADRIGVAAKDKQGNFQIISGNHMGAIIEYYMLGQLKKLNQLPDNPAFVKTIVTTDLQDRIAEDMGVESFNVFTGFKYISEKIRHFETDGNYKFICGGEESFGHMTGDYVRDKDAVGATIMVAEICAWLKKENRTLNDYLEEIFQRYGYYLDKTISKVIKGLKGSEVINQIMEHFRTSGRKEIGKVKVKQTFDYSVDKVKDHPESKYFLTHSNVIQYKLEDGSKVTLRPSGTEPKIKFYFSTFADTKDKSQAKLEQFINDFISEVDQCIKKFS
ncbi:MAG: phospho-sugar mutase [Spirochaetes bacterium]|nr:phospho-sugar mutase [Spirochaetota bacterium]